MKNKTKKIVLSSVLGISIVLVGCQSDLEKARKEEAKDKVKQEVKTDQEKYTLDDAEKILRSKLKNELRDEVKKEVTPEVEKETKAKFIKEGHDSAMKEIASDITAVKQEKLKIDDFFAKYQEK